MSATRTSDLAVERLSDALAGRRLDVVVSGSIGAVESVRFVRALRRLGANVTPWLTAGGAQFATESALAWAAGKPARTAFAGELTHLATGDALIAAPASASYLARVANGLTDTPSGALAASYLGLGRPVLMVPNMHDSLATAPTVRRNIDLLSGLGVSLVGARAEEGKQKFPDPHMLADEIAHRLNAHARAGQSVVVTFGSTRGYIDDVRYVSNYSSGALGSAVCEELYRLGFGVTAVEGACQIKPRVASERIAADTNDAMLRAAQGALRGGAVAAVLAASVLDFVPAERQPGKIASATHATLPLTLKRTEKIIAQLQPPSGVKVGFKLEAGLTPARAANIARDYLRKYALSLIVINDLAEVDALRHRALLFTAGEDAPREVTGKAEVALEIARHVAERIAARAVPGRP
jgi:phosphopantothenoylcysteine decarboxylase/phosphopantothenate--cysteine ligase